MTEIKRTDVQDLGIVHMVGSKNNRPLDMATLVRSVRDLEQRKVDVVAPRASFSAIVDNTNAFGVMVAGYAHTFRPTGVALQHLASQTKIPLDFLRNNVGRYPHLAADMVNTWIKDEHALNRTGTASERKTKTTTEQLKHLFRFLVSTQQDGTNVFRAMLSSKYMILDNADLLAVMLREVSRLPMPPHISGSLTDEKMYVRFKMSDISGDITFSGKGKGHAMIRVPCGASILVSGSDVGGGAAVFQPEIEVFSCSNLLRSTETLAQIHVGKEYKDIGILSRETIRKMNTATLARITDIAQTMLTPESFQRTVERFSEYAGLPITNPALAVENVTAKFTLTEDMGRSILDRYIQGEMPNRFGLAQAVTFQAHSVREDDFEEATRIEGIGSKILTMTERDFHHTLLEEK